MKKAIELIELLYLIVRLIINMENKLKSALGLSVVKSKGAVSGGCISQGNIFDTENGTIFVKINKESKANVMFNGEIEGLKAILSTRTVRVPNPIKVVQLNNLGTALVMEYIEMSSLSKYAEQLGELLARMHLHNSSLRNSDSSLHKKTNDDQAYVDKFGFHCTTCCGYIPQENSWKEDWVEFYSQQRLDFQLRLIESNYGDREAMELWSELSLKIPSLFKDIDIVPSLLHGDLWSGNVAETTENPVIFDPAVFYGHSEFELAIAEMFGGFPRSFYNAYHNVLPKQANFDKRKDLYKLFHCLNHWNHFGAGYRSSSISVMKRLLKDM